MGILTALNIGVSGLRASGESMSVVGNNIANANTNAFKKGRAEFQDMLSKSLKGIDGGDQVGSGVELAHVTNIFNQGSLARTDNITDLAISGNGFFMVEGPNGARNFTRDGQFHFDKDGFLINGDGYKVFGFGADESGNISSKQEKIKLGNTTVPAKGTSVVTANMNLDSREKIKQFNPQDPIKTSHFNNSITVYDNVGTSHVVGLYFNKIGDNQWQYHALVDGKEAAGGVPGQMMEMANGTLVFNNKGQLQQEVDGLNSFNFSGGAAPGQKIKFDFGKSITEGGNGNDAGTQYGSESTMARHTQDGYSAATLANLSFDGDGVLTASYTNGFSKPLSQVAISKFENNEGLTKIGKNLFKETRLSGQGAVGKPGKDGRGQIMAKTLELSNVDIAEEFVGLMNSQRNFQANVKTMTTADKMLQEVIQLKR